MVRAPCCEKMGLKKGPWTPDEDQILINYIQEHGHGNWRALPKHAGLLRCGKSCRLRWINYLRPDIKRGNFTREEEDTIIKMHEILGNRWSAIAASLPGRTDNEIKNVWHTYLKKRLENYAIPEKKRRAKGVKASKSKKKLTLEQKPSKCLPISPPHQYSSDISSVTTGEDKFTKMSMKVEPSDELHDVDENFWSEVLSEDNSSSAGRIPVIGDDPHAKIPFSPLENDLELVQYPFDLEWQDGMDFWYNLFTRADDEEALELPKM